VEMRSVFSLTWSSPQGCGELTTLSTVECVATSLSSNMEYAFRIRAECALETAKSPWKVSDPPVATLKLQSDPPDTIHASDPTPK
jgi:hypothetical protein